MIKNIKKKGFTLIELLVSIGIIATLTAILLPNFMGARERAKDAQKIQDMQAVKNALRLYYNDHQSYPAGSGITNLDSILAVGTTAYMAPTNIGFTYYQTNSGDGFQLCGWLDSGNGDDDIDSQVKCGISSVGVCGIAAGIGNTMNMLYVVCAN